MSENVAEPANFPPAFSASVHSEQGVPVVEVHGEIDLATTAALLDSIGVAGSRLNGLPIAVVDLRQTEFIDVTGVRTLIEQARSMKNLGGELRLIVPEEGPVARVFELLGIDRALDLYHDLDLFRTSRRPDPACKGYSEQSTTLNEALEMDHDVANGPDQRANQDIEPEEFEDLGPPFSALIGTSQRVPVVEVRGEVDLATLPRLLEAIGLAGSRLDGRPLLIVDLRAVELIDAYGVRVLVEEARAMEGLGGELRLVIPEIGSVARLFRLLAVGRILDVRHDLELSLERSPERHSGRDSDEQAS